MTGLRKPEAQAKTPLKEALVEAAVFAAAFAWLIYTMRHMLVFGNSTLMHDHIHGNYAPFQFLVEHLLDGRLPYWNPFSHGGKPAYPLIFHMRFFDPLVFLNIFLVSRFTMEIPVMFAWNALLTQTVMVTGLYLLLRRVADNLWVRLCIIPVLVLSSIMLGAFRVPAMLKMYVLLPYVTYFFLKIVYYRDYRWHNWLLFGALSGLNFQGVFILGPVMLLTFLLLGFGFFKRDRLRDLIRHRGNYLRLLVFLGIVVLMVFPTLTAFKERDGYIYPMRQLSKETGGYVQYMSRGQELAPQDSILLPYQTIKKTGTFATVWDVLQMIEPGGNPYLHWTNENSWGEPSEAFIYLGVLVWAAGLLGIVSGRHGLRRVLLFFMACFGLLMLGPPGGLHRVLYYVFPPLWFIRHTHTFVLFFTMSFVFFFILGLNRVYASENKGLFDAKTAGGWLFWVLAAAQVAVVLLFTPEKAVFLKNTALFLVLPAVVFYVLKRKQHIMGKHAALALPLAFTVFSLVICVDLALKLSEFSVLYESQVNPRFQNIITVPQKPVFKDTRHVVPPTVLSSANQPSRTSAVMHRRPFVFSPLEKMAQGELKYFTVPKKVVRFVPEPYQVYQRQQGPTLFVKKKEVSQMAYIFYVPTPPPWEFRSDEAAFTEAVNAKRWNTFFYSKTYFRLINSDIPPPALMDIFAVGGGMLQFKEKAVAAKDDEAVSLLEGLDPKKAKGFLEDHVFVSPPKEDTLPKDLFLPIGSVDLSGIQSEMQKDESADTGFLYKVLSYDYTTLELKVTADREGFLYWSDGYNPHWRAFVDGKETAVLRANLNFKAIQVPEGQSVVKFAFDHRGLRLSLLVFYVVGAASLLLGGALALASSRKNR